MASNDALSLDATSGKGIVTYFQFHINLLLLPILTFTLTSNTVCQNCRVFLRVEWGKLYQIR